MRESRLYLNFLKCYLWYFAVPAILFGLVGYGVVLMQPKIYTLYRLYEANYRENNISEGIVIADQVVTLVRDRHIDRLIGLSPDTKVEVYKNAPLFVNLKVSSSSESVDLDREMTKISQFVSAKYPVNQIGEQVRAVVSPNVALGLMIGMTIGGFVGLILALISSYFKNF